MGDQRLYTRVKGDSANCILMELDGKSYQAMLEDISLGGALIKISEGVPHGLHIGDDCSLELCSASNSCSSKHLCRVVRCNFGSMGIKFITMRDH
ncbi:MAG TPA: PilZ domain-containing protein [Desulfuromonadales bacterium]|nr:PilZ domain-containing protein [Desulfuromonadales bacterium]